MTSPDDSSSSSVRVDKWLWAARCFKTRSQASQACTAGHVKINQRTAKPSQSVKIGDEVDVLCPSGRRILSVKDLAERRGPASVAEGLFEDLTPPPPPQAVPQVDWHPGGGARPSKRDRRKILKLQDKW